MTHDLFSLDGHVAIVTGGLGRLGSQYAATFARAGAAVAIFDVAPSVPAPVQALVDAGLPVAVHRVDLVDRAGVFAATTAVAARFGAPTVLVNNAGLGSSPDAPASENGRFEAYPESSWDAMLDSHLKTALSAAQAFIDAFRR